MQIARNILIFDIKLVIIYNMQHALEGKYPYYWSLGEYLLLRVLSLPVVGVRWSKHTLAGSFSRNFRIWISDFWWGQRNQLCIKRHKPRFPGQGLQYFISTDPAVREVNEIWMQDSVLCKCEVVIHQFHAEKANSTTTCKFLMTF